MISSEISSGEEQELPWENDFSSITNHSIQTNLSNFLTKDNSSSSADEDYVPYGQRPETYIVPIIFAVIFIIGLLGNGVLIFIFLKHRTMRNVPNMYICSLAVGDIIVIFFCVPFTSTVYTVESWPYGLLVCKFSEFIKDLSVGVSVFTLTALSADRYFAIVDPMRKLAGRRATKVTLITITGIWIVSVLISLPSAMFSYIKVFNDTDDNPVFSVCYPFPEELGPLYPKAMVLFKALVYYFIPLLLIATFYIYMARHLVLSTRNIPGEAQQGQGRQILARKKVAKMVLSFVVIFALCFLLQHVFLLWFYFDPNSEEHFNYWWHIVRILGFCLGFLNSCINPITLYCVSGTFRKHFNNHLLCCIIPSTHRRRPVDHYSHHRKLSCCPNGGKRRSTRNIPRSTFRQGSCNSEAITTREANNTLTTTATRGSNLQRSTKVKWETPTIQNCRNNPTTATSLSPSSMRENLLSSPVVTSRNSGNLKGLLTTKPKHEEGDKYHLYVNPQRTPNSKLPLKEEITMTSFIESRNIYDSEIQDEHF